VSTTIQKIKVGSDFSGVGAFNQALIRLGIDHEELFACDMDKYARQTFCLNYGTPKYFPKDVYEREIPTESLDIYMTSPPCQSFSLAGKRLGKEDKRGILFFNSLEFIQINKPRYFIFENVKGLLSHDKTDPKQTYGKTFQEWINCLGGKSVNGVHTFFPFEDSVPYHIYFQVLNAKDYGIPQNRERVFIIGIRDDEDNDFQFPRPLPLTKRLKDVLESEVDEKYFLSNKMVDYLKQAPRAIGFSDAEKKDSENCLIATYFKMPTDGEYLKIGTWRTHEDGKGFRETEDNNCPTIPARAREDGSGQPVIKINQAYKDKLKEVEEYTCNCGNIFVGNIETPCPECGGFSGYSNELSILGYTHDEKGKVVKRHLKDEAGTIHTASGGGGNTDQFVIGAIRGRNPENPKSKESGLETEQMLEINNNGTSNALTTVQKDNVVVMPVQIGKSKQFQETSKLIGEPDQESFCVRSSQPNEVLTQQRIRRLTPLECFKLMDFNFNILGVKDFVWGVSDSQAYKQAGNSIAVGVLAAIIQNLNLKK